MEQNEQRVADKTVEVAKEAIGTTTDKAAAQEAVDKTLAQQLAENEQQIYDRSRQHIEEIEEEVRQTQPLAAPKEVIDALVFSYDSDTSPEYHRKAKELANVYSHIRRIRGDGNCFYRAVLTAQLERVLYNRTELKRFIEIVKGWRQRLFKFGFPELTTGDFCDAMDTLMDSIDKGEKTDAMLFDDLNQDGIANYYVAFMRFITSGFLRENEELYSAFIEGERNLDQYCKDEVEPMWKESDQIAAVALVNAIDVPIRIEYMDRSQGEWHHDFYPQTSAPNAVPVLYFLYRPGHYDILYKREN
uniref:Ubiquitin thioesterase n=1 Tax=Acrobeloides nanus TaxID=290746 RepID=A0A914CYD0_9BILA